MIYDEKQNLLLKINLSFFEGGEKTEKATPKKRDKAREEGQIALSKEVGTAVIVIVSFQCFKIFSDYLYRKSYEVYSSNFSLIGDINYVFNPEYLAGILVTVVKQLIIICLPIFTILLIVGVIVNIMQVKWKPTIKPLIPKLSNFNPVNGFKKIFSMKQVMELITSIMKLSIILFAVYLSLKDEVYKIQTLLFMDLFSAFTYIVNLSIDLGLKVGYYFIIIAITDYAFQQYSHEKKLRMSKNEVKDEYKNVEGDPLIKGKIKQRMREASMRRMMQDVPDADVIVTNPTHFAVAIKYEPENGAPVVVAKGADHLAKKIREKAAENDVPIYEDKPLARSLYATVEVGKQIPPETYAAIAQILVFVSDLNNREELRKKIRGE